jgi:type IV pilus assembly protein PilM
LIAARKHGLIGIDFGAKVTKIAQLDRADGNLHWRRTTIARSREGGGLPCSGDEIRRALEIHGGFRGRAAACTLSMSATDLRTITVPPGSEAERRAMIAQELESVYGANGVAREFDFWEPDATSAESGKAAESVNVLSVAAARVQELIDTLANAGLECVVLDGMPCALARAISMAAIEIAGPAAAIDWGEANATVSIVEHGRPQFTRPLRDCGAGGMYAEIGRSLGLDDAEAVEALTRFGLPHAGHADPENDEVREVLADILGGHVQRLLDELNRTFSFLRLQRQALLPRRAWLFGAGAAVRNIAPVLAEKLEIPCEIWRLAAPPGDTLADAGDEIFGPAAALSALAWTP